MASALCVVVEVMHLIRAHTFQSFFFFFLLSMFQMPMLTQGACVTKALSTVRLPDFFFSSACTSTIFRSGCFIPNSGFYSNLQFWSSSRLPSNKWYRSSAEFYNRTTFQTCLFWECHFCLYLFVFQKIHLDGNERMHQTCFFLMEINWQNESNFSVNETNTIRLRLCWTLLPLN